MRGTILAAVEDLIFLSKILETAKHVKAEVRVVSPGDLAAALDQGPAAAVFFDLNHGSGSAVETIRRIKQSQTHPAVPFIGFLSHMQGDLARAAREAGCDEVMARSAFAQQLPQLLRRYAEGAGAGSR